jgi:hypothetical protein
MLARTTTFFKQGQNLTSTRTVRVDSITCNYLKGRGEKGKREEGKREKEREEARRSERNGDVREGAA